METARDLSSTKDGAQIENPVDELDIFYNRLNTAYVPDIAVGTPVFDLEEVEQVYPETVGNTW